MRVYDQTRYPVIGDDVQAEGEKNLHTVLEKFTPPWVEAYRVFFWDDDLQSREGLYILYYPGQVISGVSRATMSLSHVDKVPHDKLFVPWLPKYNPYIGALCWECVLSLQFVRECGTSFPRDEAFLRCRTHYSPKAEFKEVKKLIDFNMNTANFFEPRAF